MDTFVPQPANSFLRSPYLTDMYQITMCYAYWKNGIHNNRAAFEVFFRKCPFGGEYAVFAGLQSVIEFLNSIHFTADDIEYLKQIVPNAEPEFYEYMAAVDARCLTVYAMKEGTLCFPMEPLIRVEGPLAVAQLIETPLLNQVGYASLVCTNAARMRVAAGPDAVLLEFGLRRAQGPDGGMSASQYAVMGGFNSTSNVLANKIHGIPLSGTHAHAFVMSFSSLADVKTHTLAHAETKKEIDFLALVLEKKKMLTRVPGLSSSQPNEGELAAFVSYALSFPYAFVALCDTYHTLNSGVPNFLAVALALIDCGYKPGGIRLDSGDLAFLSRKTRALYKETAEVLNEPRLLEAKIVASNDINEATIYSLNLQHHEIDVFGIGTNLVTCQNNPSMGVVYKLVELEGKPCVKLSDSIEKTTIPGRKECFRFLKEDGMPILDLMQSARPAPRLPSSSPVIGCTSDPITRHPAPSVPQAKESILCRHPYQENKRCIAIPARVVQLHDLVWNGHAVGAAVDEALSPSSYPSTLSSAEVEKRIRDARWKRLEETRTYVLSQVLKQREDHLRAINPTPYKVSLSDELYNFMHKTILDNTPTPILDS